MPEQGIGVHEQSPLEADVARSASVVASYLEANTRSLSEVFEISPKAATRLILNGVRNIIGVTEEVEDRILTPREALVVVREYMGDVGQSTVSRWFRLGTLPVANFTVGRQRRISELALRKRLEELTQTEAGVVGAREGATDAETAETQTPSRGGSMSIMERLERLDPNVLLTATEVADILRVDIKTVSRWAKKWKITIIFKPGRTSQLLSSTTNRRITRKK